MNSPFFTRLRAWALLLCGPQKLLGVQDAAAPAPEPRARQHLAGRWLAKGICTMGDVWVMFLTRGLNSDSGKDHGQNNSVIFLQRWSSDMKRVDSDSFNHAMVASTCNPICLSRFSGSEPNFWQLTLTRKGSQTTSCPNHGYIQSSPDFWGWNANFAEVGASAFSQTAFRRGKKWIENNYGTAHK